MLKQTNHKGFTIIEVVITIAIGAAVMALVLNAVAGARRSQRNNARVADVGAIAAAVNNYYGSRNALPADTDDFDDPLINQLAYYADASSANIQSIFVANAFGTTTANAVGEFPKFGTTAAAGVAVSGSTNAVLTVDHMGLVLEANCNADFSDFGDGGVREMALIYRLEGQDGIVCREI